MIIIDTTAIIHFYRFLISIEIHLFIIQIEWYNVMNSVYFNNNSDIYQK